MSVSLEPNKIKELLWLVATFKKNNDLYQSCTTASIQVKLFHFWATNTSVTGLDQYLEPFCGSALGHKYSGDLNSKPFEYQKHSSDVQMAFENWTIWDPTSFRPSEYQTSSVFRSPVQVKLLGRLGVHLSTSGI